MKSENQISMEIINPYAAGIDIGSRSHFVAIGQKEKDVREFGVYNQDLKSISEWLTENQIKTVAMESTGTYWQSLYAILLSDGFEVILCNGKFTKNIKGKKNSCSRLSMDTKITQYWLIIRKFFARFTNRTASDLLQA